MIAIVLGQWNRLGHKLQRPHAIAFVAVYAFTATSMLSAMVLAADDVSVVRGGQVRLCGRMKQAPVLLVHLDHFFAEGVDLAASVEPLQGTDSHVEVTAYGFGVSLGVERQLGEGVVGFLEVTVFVKLLRLLSVGSLGGRYWRGYREGDSKQ